MDDSHACAGGRIGCIDPRGAFADCRAGLAGLDREWT